MDRIILRASGSDLLLLIVEDAAAASITAAGVSIDDGGTTAALNFAQPLQGLPRSLFGPDPQADSAKAVSLKSADALKQMAEAIAAQRLRDALEALRAGLRRLRRIEADLDLGAGDFFGLKGFAGAGAAAAHVILDLTPLLADDAFVLPPQAEVALVAILAAEIGATFGAIQALVAVHCKVRLTATFELDCDFGLDLPTLPPLSIRLPRFSLPIFRFGTLAFPQIDAPDLFGLRLKLPGVQVVLDDPKPAISLGVDAAGHLTTSTQQSANGRLQLEGQDIVTFMNVALTLGAANQQDQPSGSCPLTPRSTTPSTSNAT